MFFWLMFNFLDKLPPSDKVPPAESVHIGGYCVCVCVALECSDNCRSDVTACMLSLHTFCASFLKWAIESLSLHEPSCGDGGCLHGHARIELWLVFS